jgi:hypothetical protein
MTPLTMTQAPQLSVVVPSVNGAADLMGCLDALAIDAARTPLEVLVADRVGAELRREVQQRHPWVRLIEAAPGTTIPSLRAMAFLAASAPVVAVIEDHVRVPAGWADQMLGAQQRGEEVVGGAVYNAATERVVDWAAFLCEYSHLLPPLASGPVASITGNNTAYRRDLLERFRDAAASGRWEDHLHAVLRAHGIPLYCRPEIAVGHKKHYTVWEYTSQRYLYARSFAGARVAGRPALARALYGAAAVLLPPLLLARIVGRVWARPPYRPMLVRSLPLLPLFVAAWAAGEVVGAWLGPGDALSRVC